MAHADRNPFNTACLRSRPFCRLVIEASQRESYYPHT
jgi:hypothetical protein